MGDGREAGVSAKASTPGGGERRRRPAADGVGAADGGIGARGAPVQ